LLAKKAYAGIQTECNSDVDSEVNICGGEAVSSLFHVIIISRNTIGFTA